MSNNPNSIQNRINSFQQKANQKPIDPYEEFKKRKSEKIKLAQEKTQANPQNEQQEKVEFMNNSQPINKLQEVSVIPIQNVQQQISQSSPQANNLECPKTSIKEEPEIHTVSQTTREQVQIQEGQISQSCKFKSVIVQSDSEDEQQIIQQQFETKKLPQQSNSQSIASGIQEKQILQSSRQPIIQVLSSDDEEEVIEIQTNTDKLQPTIQLEVQKEKVNQMQQNQLKSKFVESSDEEDEKNNQNQKQQYNSREQQKQQQQQYEQQQQQKQQQNANISNIFQIKPQVQEDNLQNTETLIKQAESDEEIQPESEIKVNVNKVESERSDEELEEKDQVEIEQTETDSSNRIRMSVYTQDITKSLRIQQELTSNIHASFRADNNQLQFQSKIVFMNNSSQAHVVRVDEYFLSHINQIIVLQKSFRLKYIKKKYKIMLKRFKYRKNVIKELISTEEQYVKDLNIIITELLTPLKNPKNEQDMKKIFNVETIYGLNKDLLKQLLIQKETLDKFPYQQTMKVVIDYLPYFKLYYDYCKNYNAAVKLFEYYEKTNDQFKETLSNIYKSNVLRGLDANSFIVKPVQRLPKYILLYKDLLKHTDSDHPDYKNIDDCLQQFIKVNDANNSEMEKYLNQVKLSELQQFYGNHVFIAEPTRQFIFEDTCQYYSQKKELPIILYAFNNLLLIVTYNEQGIQKYLHHLVLTAESILKDTEDTQFYENLFEIVSFNDSITFICKTDQNKQSFKEKLQKILDELINTKKNKLNRSTTNEQFNLMQQRYHVIVKLVGTENRNTTQMKPYTAYIVLITIEGIEQKIYVRYSSIANLEGLVRKYDPQLKIPHFSSMKWLSNQDAKVIDERRLMIEKFLQLVLSSDVIRTNQEFREQILKSLSIDLDFYNLPEKRMSVSRESYDQQTVMRNMLASQFQSKIQPNQLQSLILTRQATKILAAAQDVSHRMTICDFNNDQDIKIGNDATQCEQQINVGIGDGTNVLVGFSKYSRVYAIKGAIANHLKMTQCIDYKLFIGDTSEEFRVIDDQETLFKVIGSNENVESKSFGLKNFAQKFGKMFTTQHKFKVHFRKYFYLTISQEEADLKKDLNRLRIITYEIFEEISKEKFPLSFTDYCINTALYIMIRQFEQNQQSKNVTNFDPAMLNNVIPNKIQRTNKQQLWCQQIITYIKQLETKLIQQQQENIKQMEQKKIQLITELTSLTQLMFINNIKFNRLFGMQIFFVECPKSVQQEVKKQLNTILTPNIYIGCNYQNLCLLTPSDKQIICGFGYELITNMKSYTNEFQMKIKNVNFTFKSPIAYEIKQLIIAYQEIHIFTDQLKMNA